MKEQPGKTSRFVRPAGNCWNFFVCLRFMYRTNVCVLLGPGRGNFDMSMELSRIRVRDTGKSNSKHRVVFEITQARMLAQ